MKPIVLSTNRRKTRFRRILPPPYLPLTQADVKDPTHLRLRVSIRLRASIADVPSGTSGVYQAFGHRPSAFGHRLSIRRVELQISAPKRKETFAAKSGIGPRARQRHPVRPPFYEQVAFRVSYSWSRDQL